MIRLGLFFFFFVAGVSPTYAQSAEQNPAYTCGLSNFQQEFIQRLNEARSKGRRCGSKSFGRAGPLHWNRELTVSAAGHSYDMAKNNYFDHKGHDGSTFVDRINDAGYEWSNIGENISAGRRTVAEAMNGWLSSPPHCANIMNPSFTDVGVACVQRSGTRYSYHWTMNLGRPKSPKSFQDPNE